MNLSSGFHLASVYAQESQPLLSPWVLALLFIVLVVLFVWLLLRWRSSRAVPSETEPVKESAQAETDLVSRRISVVAPEPRGEAVVSAPAAGMDDLEIIEGIGPKIAGVLNQAGITSYTQLAGMTPEEIEQVLQAGGIRLADPRSWPEQARLAGAGDLYALQTLQARLKGGREV